MNVTLEQRISTASTTRISSDLEKMWRNQFFAEQGRTPAKSFAGVEEEEPRSDLRQMTRAVRFAGGVYDGAIVKFYEDIIIELQKEVDRYKSLWASAQAATEEDEPESYLPRQTVKLSPEFAKKLSSGTRKSLRISAE
jgi:hypothetical protein